MSAEEAIRAELVANAPLVALVGANGVWFGSAPDDAKYPFVLYDRISRAPVTDLSDGIGALSNYRMQFDIVAANRDQANAVGAAVRGAMAGSSAFGAVLANDFFSSEGEPEEFVLVQEYSVWHTTT